jgi:probable rRNA maturation factor
VSASALRRRAEKMLGHLGLFRPGVELSVALVNDEAIRELNRSFRRKDKPTDVLAFPMSDAPKTERRSGLLGDVILSIETARRQAEANSRALAAELTMLLAHGLLHLLGYDHQTDEEEREMTALTRELEEAATRRTSKTPKTREMSGTKPTQRAPQNAASSRKKTK